MLFNKFYFSNVSSAVSNFISDALICCIALISTIYNLYACLLVGSDKNVNYRDKYNKTNKVVTDEVRNSGRNV